MALSAKQHILKLRETEYKLQKLQSNLLNINKDDATMSEFLAHHKELMALPGSNRDSVPFRFSFEAPKRYIEMKQSQKLTLPPKIPSRSASRLNRYKDTFDADEGEQKIGNRSKALHSLLNELEKQASKMVIAFPKLDKLTLLNKTPFLRSLQNSKHSYFNTGNPNPPKKFKPSSTSKGFASAPVSTHVSKLASKASINKARAKKLNAVWNKKVSDTASTATAELIFPEASKEYEKKLDKNGNSITGPQPEKLLTKENDSEKTGENLAYALGASNLMGVILPPKPSLIKSRGPDSWTEKKSTLSVSMSSGVAPATTASDIDDSENISAKEAMTILRRRKFPERKSHFPERKSPHERGLIGIEISSFDPQCAFFYRDRSGNYNPHLFHSKNVTDGLKKAKSRRSKPVRHSLG